MDRLLSELMIYGNMQSDPVLSNLGEVCAALRSVSYREAMQMKGELMRKTGSAVRQMAEFAETCSLTGNIWHQYLAWLLINDENPFSLAAEGTQVRQNNTVSRFAMEDFRILRKLFAFDFSEQEKLFGRNLFSGLENYKPVKGKAADTDAVKGAVIRELSENLASAENEKEMFRLLAAFYKERGVGCFSLQTAFRIGEVRDASGNEVIKLLPVRIDPSIRLSDLVGYELQKKQLTDNTEAFCKGKKANDALLYGDNGTGKSTSIKAVLNEYSSRGLRLVEVNKYQFRLLPELMTLLSGRHYRFLIFIDDLSFEEDEIEYKFLKSVIEGGIENRPDNILLYATSNRRHLIRELWDDRKDMEHSGEIHHSDTVEEKISLSSRFGVTINYSKPNKQEYEEIVLALAEKEGIRMDKETLLAEADRWELRHGGFTGRVARQFINHIAGHC